MKKLPIILTAAVITTVLGGTAALAAGNNSRNAYGSENQKTPYIPVLTVRILLTALPMRTEMESAIILPVPPVKALL